MAGKVCKVCGNLAPHLTKGRCNTCAMYFYRHGCDRPPDLIRRQRRKPSRQARKGSGGFCTNCELELALCRGLCNACYLYRLRHGVDRPDRLWLAEQPCKRCGRPPGDLRMTDGYCRTCYSYKWKNDKERPLEWIRKAAPLGWCGCGKPALTVELVLGQEVGLCAVCEGLREGAKKGEVEK